MKAPPVANNIWFPFYMGDYLAKTSHLSQSEHGAYLCLLLYYYSNKRPISHSRRYSICRAFAEQEQSACDAVLSEYFTREGDMWINERAEAELAKSQDISQKRANAARSRVAANAEQMQSKCRANAEQMQIQSQSQSHTPLPSEVHQEGAPTEKQQLVAEKSQAPSTLQALSALHAALKTEAESYSEPLSKYCIEGEVVKVTRKQRDEWQALYPEIDVIQHLASISKTYSKRKAEGVNTDGWFFAVARSLDLANQAEALKKKEWART